MDRYIEIMNEEKQILSCEDKAPEELRKLIVDAMIKFGPDGHCDGNDVIAQLVWNWFRANPSSPPQG